MPRVYSQTPSPRSDVSARSINAGTSCCTPGLRSVFIKLTAEVNNCSVPGLLLAPLNLGFHPYGRFGEQHRQIMPIAFYTTTNDFMHQFIEQIVQNVLVRSGLGWPQDCKTAGPHEMAIYCMADGYHHNNPGNDSNKLSFQCGGQQYLPFFKRTGLSVKFSGAVFITSMLEMLGSPCR